MNFKTIADISWKGKSALVRVDFNVPYDTITGEIADDRRIASSIPTIEFLRTHGAKVILCTHLGRPGGEYNDGLHLTKIAEKLSHMLDFPVEYVHDAVGELAQKRAALMSEGEILMLENIRFYPGEEANTSSFASSLASLADVFVNDAFGTAHRAHASTEGITHYIPSVAGFLMEKELQMLSLALENPKRPLSAIVGGAKINDKIAILGRLMAKADTIMVGGGMVASFISTIKGELPKNEMEQFCSNMMAESGTNSASLILPKDVVVSKGLTRSSHATVPIDGIPDGWSIADIGPATVDLFRRHLESSETIIWNGPMGIFEIPEFASGTVSVAEFLSASHGTTIIGGGSTGEAVEKLGLSDRMAHVSTGGGASLEFLEGRILPGVAALENPS